MQNSELFTDIINKIKEIKHLQSDAQVAKELDMTRNNLYGFKKRGNLPLKNIHDFCSREGVRLEYIIDGKLPIHGNDIGQFPKIPGHGFGTYVGETQTPYSQIVKISDPLIQKTAAILESSTVYSTALKSNIEAFHHAMTCEEQLAVANKRIDVLEENIKAIEKRLPAVVES